MDLLRLDTVDLLLSWQGEAVEELLTTAFIWSQSPTLVPTSGVLSPICCFPFFCWLIVADQPLLSVTQWLDVTLVVDLSGLLLAVLGVVVLLSLLGTSFHLELVDLLQLELVILFLSWECENVGKLSALPLHVSLAYFALGLSRVVVTALFHPRWDVLLSFLDAILHLKLVDFLRL